MIPRNVAVQCEAGETGCHGNQTLGYIYLDKNAKLEHMDDKDPVVDKATHSSTHDISCKIDDGSVDTRCSREGTHTVVSTYMDTKSEHADNIDVAKCNKNDSREPGRDVEHKANSTNSCGISCTFDDTSEEPSKCDTCGEMYRQSIHMTQHSITHTGAKVCKRGICEKSFPGSISPKDHIRTHSGEKTKQM